MSKEVFTYFRRLQENLQGSVPGESFLYRCLWHRGLVWYILKDEASQRDAENKDGMEGVGRGREAPGLLSCCIQVAQRESHREALPEGRWCRLCLHSSAPPGSSPRLKWQLGGLVLHFEKLGLGSGGDLVIHFPRRFSFNTNRNFFFFFLEVNVWCLVELH